jgi:hypothetical protein
VAEPVTKRDGAYFPELRRALAGDPEALSALYRLEASLAPVLATVERYGRIWAKDTDYYAAAEVLGITEPPAAVPVSVTADQEDER